MNEHNEQMKSIRHFWHIYKNDCCLIRSIDAVYNKYCEYHITYVDKSIKYIYKPINKYRFRTFIRKHGYNNGGVMMTIKNKNKK
jgi:hypothetical protein